VQAINNKNGKTSPEIKSNSNVSIPQPIPAGPCRQSGTPPTPSNLKVTKNQFNSGTKKTEIIVTWTNNVNTNMGCVTSFRFVILWLLR
jgi:hypothetical protein